MTHTLRHTTTPNRCSGVSAGRWSAPPLVEHGPHGQPLARPYPRRRITVRRALRLAGAAITAAVALTGTAPLLAGLAAVLLVGLAPTWLAERLVTLPHPTFVTVGYAHPHTLTSHEWIRLPDGWAVQTYDVRVITPETLGDPTPPVVQMRCSDATTRSFRPHDVVHVVAPVDLT